MKEDSSVALVLSAGLLLGGLHGLVATSCGASEARPAAYAAVAAACTAYKQSILDRHGDHATAADEVDFESARRVCAEILERIETSGGER